MRVSRQPRPGIPRMGKLRHQPDQLPVPVHWLDRAEPQPGQRRLVKNPPHQPRQRPPQQSHFACIRRTGKIPAPSPQVDPRKHQLVTPGRHKPFHLPQNARNGQTPGGSARLRNHAKRASIRAPLLNLQVGPGLRPRHNLRLLQKRVRKAIIHPDLRRTCRRTSQQRLHAH
jgi:hypothetical protein